MKILLNTKELSNGLELASKAISSKTTLTILEGFKLEAKNGCLTIKGSNLELNIETKVPASIEEEGEIVINASKLVEIIKKLPNDQVSLITKNDVVNIKSGKISINLPFMNAQEYPEFPSLSEENCMLLKTSEFKNMLKSVLFAIAQDETRPILTGVLFEIENNILRLVALDGYRLSFKEMKVNAENTKFVVPGKTLIELLKILPSEDELHLTIENNRILFTFKETIITSKLLEGQYVNYKSLLPQDKVTSLTVNRKEFLDMLDRTNLVITSNQNCIHLDVQSDNILKSVGKSTLGEIEEEIDCKVEGEGLLIAFNSRYLIDACKSIEDEEITIDFTTPTSPTIIKSEGDFYHLILPIRIIR